MESLKRELWERGQKKIFEKVIAEYFPNLVKTMSRRSKKPSNPHASQKEEEKEQQQKGIPTAFTVTVLKAGDKEKTLKYPEKKPHVQTNKHRMLANF